MEDTARSPESSDTSPKKNLSEKRPGHVDLTSRLYLQPVKTTKKPKLLGVSKLNDRTLMPLPSSTDFPGYSQFDAHKLVARKPYVNLDGPKMLPDLRSESLLQDSVIPKPLKKPAVLPDIAPSSPNKEKHVILSDVAINVLENSAPKRSVPSRENLYNRDPVQFLAAMSKKPSDSNEFVYMMPTKLRSSPLYNPYDLCIVEYVDIDRNDYYTISREGVTHFSKGNAEFTPAQQWLREREIFYNMMNIPFFSKYRYWKAYTVWKKNIRLSKISASKDSLRKKLFLLNPILRSALLELRKDCIDLTLHSMLNFTENKTYGLGEFVQEQDQFVVTEVKSILQNFEKSSHDRVETACKESLQKVGFVVPEAAKNADDILVQHPDTPNEAVSTLTFTEQAARKNECRKLQRFVKLADYLIVSGVQGFVVNSTTEFLDRVFKNCNDTDVLLKQDEKKTPVTTLMTSEVLAMGCLPTPKKNIGDMEALLSNTKAVVDVPLFCTELDVSDESVAFSPTSDNFIAAIDSTLTLLVNTADTAALITASIPYLNLNDRFEENEFAEGPSIGYIVLESLYFQALVAHIKGSVEGNFNKASAFAKSFIPFSLMVAENEKIDFDMYSNPESIQGTNAEAMLQYFEEAMDKYMKQRIDMEKIAPSTTIKNLKVDTSALKAKFLPSPQRCLDKLMQVLPGLARNLNESLLNDVNYSVRILSSQPSSVEAFVEYLDHLKKVRIDMPHLESQHNQVNRLYGLMEKFEMKIDPTDLAMYQTLSPTMRHLKEAADIAEDHREENIQKYAMELEKNIQTTIAEVLSIRNRAQDQLVLSPTSKPDQVLRFLDDLISDADKLATQAEKNSLYQAQFKVSVTKNSELEETRSELQLKRLLWSSLQEWQTTTRQWRDSPFDSIVPDDMNASIQQYLKIAYQLDKGLPPNEVAPKLRQQIEEYRTIFPTIVDLRNPALKQRHWEKIQEAVGKQISKDETFTLGHLRDMRVFDFRDDISNISVQASSEATLEEMLAKVVKSWSETEFIPVPYRDYKDVYILGGVDDIQTLLEDSQVIIATIKSSRFIGPIKIEVEKWDKQLGLFSETLDSWLTCQRSWLYLESIFGAPDIQRQLPEEAKMFVQVDRSWKEIMRKVARNPNAMKSATAAGVLETMQQNNSLLDKIQKCLEDYLESKRLLFPRFYFLSNDELLDILAQTRNPQAVQPHLSKCFDAIKSLEFTNEPRSIDILAMVSPEGERFPFVKTLKARGNVEAWLSQVEESMFTSVKKSIKSGLAEFSDANRASWLLEHFGQVVLAVTQILWCRDVNDCLKSSNPIQALNTFKTKCISNLSQVATLVRGDLTKLQRAILSSLITLDVHSRDIVHGLLYARVSSPSDFEWTKQMRYFWDTDLDNVIVRMTDTSFDYGNEYLGCSGRLVITPLTDRCYLTLTSAISMNLGGSPVGPAGTGKTETVKDLSKALARQCIVFNCSDNLDFKMMGKMFAGLAQSGAWCCFDEFNRIDIEVLSVIAQQLLAIKGAKDSKATKFIFEGREIRLITTCAAFITMNPGYAGRTELPDNLKALFRPIAMMIPDYGLIAEIILFSEGFENAKVLSGKVVNMYKLCNEQLSRQDHYDFGMRAVKSVLVMAGQLKRSSPNLSEDVILIRSLRDSNMPKFLAEDIPLFKGILSDLFPGVAVPDQDYGVLLHAIKAAFVEKNLEVVPAIVDRIIQLYDTTRVRHGVMLVGPTGGGKTTSYQILATALTRLREHGNPNQDFQTINTFVLNPKSITITELYGEYNLNTMEWMDGLIGNIIRAQVTDTTPVEKWTIFDGPVDALWIENMNSVLDDNKLLCLANGERIKFNSTMHMIFEVADLSVASPATVSRCGMVYMDSSNLGWQPIVRTWLQQLPEKVTDYAKSILSDLFTNYVERGINFIRRSCKEYVPTVDVNVVNSLCRLITTFVNRENVGFNLSSTEVKQLISHIFMFCYVWSVGGNLMETSQAAFDSFVRQLFEGSDVAFPTAGVVYNYHVDLKTRSFLPWDELVPAFQYQPNVPYFQLIVPTSDTVRYAFLLESLLNNNYPVLFNGSTGVGKSVVIQDLLIKKGNEKIWTPLFINFSAQTTSKMTQQSIEAKLEKKRKNVLGAPSNAKVILFIDDLNLPKLDNYGSQPPVELLRQLVDGGGFYDREKLFWKYVQDVTLAGACAPPGGGRNNITPRLTRHFTCFTVSMPSDLSLIRIFRSIVDGFFMPFATEVRSCTDAVVNSSIEIYKRMCSEILPTPTKSHYTFNLRDLSKVIQGVLQAKPHTIPSKIDLGKLFCHESGRIFHDRLVDSTDRTHFNKLLMDVVEKNFGLGQPKEFYLEAPILFGDFTKKGVAPEERLYIELKDGKQLNSIFDDYLEEYNVTFSKDMRLIFFAEAKQHICRISRIIRQPRGNGLLVGVGGTGKQSLTKLACHMADYQCIQIELTRSYGLIEWREDIKKLYRLAGVDNKNTVFLLTDSHIKSETFLEDINNILNTGEIPNLFDFDERERVLGAVRQDVREKGLSEDRDTVYQFFINRVRDNLHIVYATSPVGDTFRNRCRMFPSLVNCSTIDWFDEWPHEALRSVSTRFLEFIDLGSDEMREKISNMCVEIHTSVGKLSKKFYDELRRRYYTTPTSYLELINLYTSMLQEKRKDIGAARDKLKSGLQKLAETNETVAKMQVELHLLGPELIKKSKDVETLMVQIAKDQETADAVKKVVSEEEQIVKESAKQTEQIAADAQKDLDEALPMLEAAFKALDALEKKDIAEMKAFSKPPELVMIVMEAICILFKVKPDWENSKKILSDPSLLKKMTEYDKDNIPETIVKKLKKYVELPTFTPEAVEKVSRAAKSMCMWARALDLYSKVFKDVQPKRQRLEEAQRSLEATREKLREKELALQEIELQLQNLKQRYEESIAEKKLLSDKTEETTKRLQRASKLTVALSDEEIRWKESVKSLDEQLGAIVGNVFLAAACVAYFGAFTAKYRDELVSSWVEKCEELGIPVSANFSLITCLVDPVQVRDWNASGLPTDKLSTENGILVNRGRRWPLMIDPQGQANRWIRNMEGSELKVIKLTEPKFLRTLENAVRTGQAVLLEDVGETLDPALEPLLLKQIIRQGGRLLMKLGDTLVDYDKNFRLYITTKLPNPHYLPEICIKVTIINFTVTKEGLEGQLLGDTVKLERPELEAQRDNLVVNLSRDKRLLKEIEEKILKMLYNSQGNILDDEELINALNQSKITSTDIMERVKQSEITEHEIEVAREKYRPVAIRGSILYFVLADLAEIDPMYQFSLRYFKTLFNNCIQSTPKNTSLTIHIDDLCQNITAATFSNVSRALFEQHKMIFSFTICAEIMRQAELFSSEEWNFFLRGSTAVRNESLVLAKPEIKWLSDSAWKTIQDLASAIPEMSSITSSLSNDPSDWEAFINTENVFKLRLPIENSQETLTDFHKLLLVKILREEYVIPTVIEFVKRNLSAEFVTPPSFDLPKVYRDTTSNTPLIFILSPGSDPVAPLLKFARDMNYGDRLHMISLGQGQGPIADELIRKSMVTGDWVFLQNCHLAASWMLKLETIVKDLWTGESSAHPDFRLFLSSMPSKVFPISILQDAIKVTNEPPKGLRASLGRIFNEISKETYENGPQGARFKKLLFGLCFFNALIHERKKFGPLGWNINYDWSASDLEVSIIILKNLLSESKTVSWEALNYMTGEITFGGRVTDDWDRRCLRSILGRFYNPRILEDTYKFSKSGIYFAPSDGDIEFLRSYIDHLPFNDEPEVFGMHENANISYQVRETRRLVRTVLDVQPRLISLGNGKSAEEIVMELANTILATWPAPFDTLSIRQSGGKQAANQVYADLFKSDQTGRLYNSLSTVLLQEADRFNKLLRVVKKSLEEVNKAIKGIVVMSSDMELVFRSIRDNEVPVLWANVAYPSLKPLSSWVADLHERIAFFRNWFEKGQPRSFWLPGFFFPQGFLTGALQNHARKYNIAIDSLTFSFEVLAEDQIPDYGPMENEHEEKDGIIVRGLFLEGARWDLTKRSVQDAHHMEMFSAMPLIRFLPKKDYTPEEEKLYVAPLYKTTARAGTLSSTGLSTNFVVAVHLETEKPSHYWIARGVAMVCALNE